MKSRTILFFWVFLVCTIYATNHSCNPNQIHLSFGDSYYSAQRLNDLQLSTEAINDNQVYLVWQSHSHCQYTVQVADVAGQNLILNKTTDFHTSLSYNFTEGQNNETYNSMAYTTLFQNLSYETPYQYSILRNNTIVAGPFQFKLASPNITNTQRQIVVAGNMNAQQGNITIEQLNTFVNVTYAGLIELGDFGGQLEANNGTNGDKFFNSIQNITSVVPLIASPGKLAAFDNYSFFNLRIRNPLFNDTDNKNQYFSFNLQGIHFVSINFNYYETSDVDVQNKMYSWIENDLKEANDPTHRQIWPWIVVVSSQPIYCLDSSQNVPEGEKCYNFYNLRQKWDEIFHKYQVDLMISAGLNDYQRLNPIYQNESVNYTQDNEGHTIFSPSATIYIIEGSAGNNNTNPNQYKASGFAKYVDTDSGYGVIYAENNVPNFTLIYKHYDSDTGELVDYVNLVKANGIASRDVTTEIDTTNAEEESSSNPLFLEIFIPMGIVIAFIVGVIIWRRKNNDPELERLNLQEYKSNKIYGKRSGDTTISMVDLVL